MSDDLVLTQHGRLTLETMLALLVPGAIDAGTIVGRRVRWSYSTNRRDNQEAKLVCEELKKLHYRLGAAEVVVHRGPWLADPI